MAEGTGYLTSNDIIAEVQRVGIVPTNQITFQNSDILAIANEELKIGMLPSILQYHEEFFVTDSAPVTILPNISNYVIPYRAIGGKFRELFFQDTQGNLFSTSRVSPDHRPFYQNSATVNHYLYYFIQGNYVVLLPNVSSSPTGSLIFSYFFRPNDLVTTDRVATILSTSVIGSTTTYTVDQIPASLTSFVQDGVPLTGFSTASRLDLLQRRPGHRTLSFDIYPTAINSNTLTISFNTTDVDSTVIPGDYIAFAGECIIPQIPSELHTVLAQRVIKRIMQAQGDQQAFQNSVTQLTEMEKNTGILVDNRSEGNPKKVNNIKGILSISRISKRRWW